LWAPSRFDARPLVTPVVDEGESPCITPINNRQCNLRWTAASADVVSWIFINGEFYRGPLSFDETERSVRIPLRAEDVIALEVHDLLDDTVVPDAVEVEPNTQPTLSWNAVADAARYRIYHHAGDDDESLIYDHAAADGIEQYAVTCPIVLDGQGGVWHHFRVEAVDEYGNESTRLAWTYFAMDLPPAVERISVAAGSGAGTYTFTLTPEV